MPKNKELSLPYGDRSHIFESKPLGHKIVYPATIADFLEKYSVLDCDGSKILRLFSSKWGKSLIREMERERIVFQDRIFSKAIIISLAMETKQVLSADGVKDEIPLRDREYGNSYSLSLVRHFLNCSFVQRLESSSPELADDMKGYILNSKAFATVFSVLSSHEAEKQYEDGRKSGNPYEKQFNMGWIASVRKGQVKINLAQVAGAIECISPKLCHPELISYITGTGSNNEVNVPFMERLRGLLNILKSIGATPGSEDKTVSLVLSKLSYLAASAKVRQGIAMKEYLKYAKDDSIIKITSPKDKVTAKLRHRWLDEGKTLFWLGILDASSKRISDECMSHVGGTEEDAKEFSHLIGQFLSFKSQGVAELGVYSKPGMYTKVLANGVKAIHHGDLPGLKQELQTLMMLSKTICPPWAYQQQHTDKEVFGIFEDCPQLTLCALGYLTQKNAASLLKKDGFRNDEFSKNAELFFTMHKKLALLVAVKKLSNESLETAQLICKVLDKNLIASVNGVAGHLGFDAPNLGTPEQRKIAHDKKFLEKYMGKTVSDMAGKTYALQMIVLDKLDKKGPNEQYIAIVKVNDEKKPRKWKLSYAAQFYRKLNLEASKIKQ